MNKKMHFLRNFIIAAAVLLGLCALVVFLFDPFFHYHKPWFGLKAVQADKEYQVVGVLRNLDYDAVIAGSSVTENNNNNWFDEDFGCSSVKATRSYGATADLCWLLDVAHEGHDLKYVFYNIDPTSLSTEPETTFKDAGCPMYLYDQNPFNDVEYLFNKTVLCEKIPYMIMKSLTGYDEGLSYNWWETKTFSRESAMFYYDSSKEKCEMQPADSHKELLSENMALLTAEVESHPETQYYFFFPPYSVLWWDLAYYDGDLESYLYDEKVCMERLLNYDNVKIYNFQGIREIVCDLDNYMDFLHFHPDINHKMTDWMAEGTYEIRNEEDIEAVLREVRDIAENGIDD